MTDLTKLKKYCNDRTCICCPYIDESSKCMWSYIFNGNPNSWDIEDIKRLLEGLPND